MKDVSKFIKDYVEKNVFPCYATNDQGHGLEHIKYVIKRSLRFARENNKKRDSLVDMNMVYVIAAYHDVGHHIDAKNHEKVSAEMLKNDKGLLDFFGQEEIETMSQAVEDHRASAQNLPRNIYGEIVSSADRNTEIAHALKRTYQYNLARGESDVNKNMLISISHLKDKFGQKGYATEKMFFKDKQYEKFLKDIQKLTNNQKKFKKAFYKVNKIKD